MTETTTPAAAPVADRMAAARAARAAKKALAAPEAAAPTTPAAAPVAEDKGLELPAGPTVLEKVAANQEEKRAAKIAALRAAKIAGPDTTVEPMVKVRVLKLGHGKISMGEHFGGLGDLTYDHGETATFPKSIAEALEEKGFVEI